MTVTVISRIDLPDIPRGVPTRVQDTARIRGLASRALLSYVEEPPRWVNPRTIAQILLWVDSDPRRAEVARARELRADRPRSTLVARLDKVIEDGVRQDGGQHQAGSGADQPDPHIT